jgi:hypothetical protein
MMTGVGSVLLVASQHGPAQALHGVHGSRGVCTRSSYLMLYTSTVNQRTSGDSSARPIKLFGLVMGQNEFASIFRQRKCCTAVVMWPSGMSINRGSLEHQII